MNLHSPRYSYSRVYVAHVLVCVLFPSSFLQLRRRSKTSREVCLHFDSAFSPNDRSFSFFFSLSLAAWRLILFSPSLSFSLSFFPYFSLSHSMLYAQFVEATAAAATTSTRLREVESCLRNELNFSYWETKMIVHRSADIFENVFP